MSVPAVPDREARRLAECEKWSAPHSDDFWGLVKHRLNCEVGGPHNPYKWVRITPDGLRALALAVEKYGLPEITPKAERQAA